MIKLSDYLAKRLFEHYKQERIFLVSGGGAMHLNDSFGRYIPYTCFHNEQACAFAAEGYARVNQKLAVVNVTTGPGGLNCLNGLFGQWTDSVPVLYISGQVKKQTMMLSYPDIKLRQLGDQEVDIISVVKPLTKYAVTVQEPNKIKYCLDKAIYEATTGRKGPVWLNIPIDVQSAIIDENNLESFVKPVQNVFDFDTDEILSKLQKAKKPLIIAGHGIRLANQINEFKNLADSLKIPIVTTFNGFDILDKNNPYYIGRIGTIGQRAGNFTLQNADLILCLGTRNNIRQISYNWVNFAKNAYKIAVDIDREELNKPLINYDMKIQADLADFIPKLLESIKDVSFYRAKWFEFCQNLKNKYSFENYTEHTQKEQINPYYFIKSLTDKINKNDILISANATPSICIFQIADLNGERVIMNSGDASMGFALPASIGASYQAKGKIIAIEGDGSMMMNLQELQTIVHNNLPIKIFVINNSGYSSIKQSQKNFFNGHLTGSDINSGVSMPDFEKVAQAFGIKAIKLSDPNKTEEIINMVLEEKAPILCEVIVQKDYIFAPKLSSKSLPDGTILSPTLEDMYPFLDKKEFEENIFKG